MDGEFQGLQMAPAICGSRADNTDTLHHPYRSWRSLAQGYEIMAHRFFTLSPFGRRPFFWIVLMRLLLLEKAFWQGASGVGDAELF